MTATAMSINDRNATTRNTDGIFTRLEDKGNELFDNIQFFKEHWKSLSTKEKVILLLKGGGIIGLAGGAVTAEEQVKQQLFESVAIVTKDEVKESGTSNINTNNEAKKVQTNVINFNTAKKAIISLDSLGAGDPPLKIGNITIDEKDMVNSFVNKLGMYDMTARLYANNIQKIRNSEYQSQYVKVIKIIDKFVADGKLTSEQGWVLLLFITDDTTFNRAFKSGSKMHKLFQEALKDKDVKAFYKAGNQNGYMMTGGTLNAASFSKLVAYAAEDDKYSKYANYGNAMNNNSAVEQSENDLKLKIAKLKAKENQSAELSAEIKKLEAQLETLQNK